MPASISDLTTYYKNNRLKSHLLLALSIFVAALIIIRIVLSPAIIYGATSWLKKQNIDATIEAINISLFNGTVSLLGASGSRDGVPLFNIGRVDIFWQWTPLSDKTIEVTKVSLDKFTAGIESYSNKMIIGGVHLPLDPQPVTEGSTNDDVADEASIWGAKLGEITFTNLNTCYLQHTSTYELSNINNLFVDYCIKLDEMTWSGNIRYATESELLATDDLPIAIEGNFYLSGLTLTDNKLSKTLLSSQSATIESLTVTGLNKLHIGRLDITALSALQRDDKNNGDTTIHLKQFELTDINLNNLNTLLIKSITLDGPGLYLVKPDASAWEYQRWMPATVTQSKAAKSHPEAQTAIANNFKIAISDVKIIDSNFCYLENSNSLNYCFTLGNISLTGNINYQTLPSDTNKTHLISDGKLNLINANIHNYTLDRNLLALKSLTLSEIDLRDVDHLTLARIELSGLTTLQRGEKPGDNSLSFKQLILDSVKYDASANAIAIDSIVLDDLNNKFSINSDGKWEHDKWLPKTPTPVPDKIVTTDSPATTKPWMLSLNKLNINSKKALSFTDNSTEPALDVGIEDLEFKISKLNSNTPAVDSPLKLTANTTQHSTIDLDGTIRPFADKVSLGIEGKLKGFDLRTASPATKKAIGHIIKSGQLDADLHLRAVDGVLDSNIALSLYQFNIKPMSEKDSAKLDKKFGMPLNQTLTLLRDKDDSIHLDIPITGDINNPNFDPMDAIIKATSKAATVTLITFYTPYGLIYAGGNVLFDLATAMKFDPIKFNSGSPELLSENKEQLDNLAKLLTEKPQIHLTLCGITNQADLFALYPEKKKPEASNAIALSETEAQSLNKLATERQNNSKNYLIDVGKLAPDRLIVCEPEHRAEKDAIAGVEINI